MHHCKFALAPLHLAIFLVASEISRYLTTFVPSWQEIILLSLEIGSWIENSALVSLPIFKISHFLGLS
jgi:hypothetical protein